MEFIQKRRFNSRRFNLLEDEIIIDSRTLSKNTKYSIKLDEIGYNINYQADSTILGKIVFIITTVISIALLFIGLLKQGNDVSTFFVISGMSAFLSLLNILKMHQDDIILSGGQHNLIFYRNKPNEEKVIEFINQLILASKHYMRKKYTRVDINIPEDTFMNRLYWLQEKEVITDADMYKLKKEYDIKKLF